MKMFFIVETGSSNLVKVVILKTVYWKVIWGTQNGISENPVLEHLLCIWK